MNRPAYFGLAGSCYLTDLVMWLAYDPEQFKTGYLLMMLIALIGWWALVRALAPAGGRHEIK